MASITDDRPIMMVELKDNVLTIHTTVKVEQRLDGESFYRIDKITCSKYSVTVVIGKAFFCNDTIKDRNFLIQTMVEYYKGQIFGKDNDFVNVINNTDIPNLLDN